MSAQDHYEETYYDDQVDDQDLHEQYSDEDEQYESDEHGSDEKEYYYDEDGNAHEVFYDEDGNRVDADGNLLDDEEEDGEPSEFMVAMAAAMPWLISLLVHVGLFLGLIFWVLFKAKNQEGRPASSCSSEHEANRNSRRLVLQRAIL